MSQLCLSSCRSPRAEWHQQTARHPAPPFGDLAVVVNWMISCAVTFWCWASDHHQNRAARPIWDDGCRCRPPLPRPDGHRDVLYIDRADPFAAGLDQCPGLRSVICMKPSARWWPTSPVAKKPGHQGFPPPANSVAPARSTPSHQQVARKSCRPAAAAVRDLHLSSTPNTARPLLDLDTSRPCRAAYSGVPVRPAAWRHLGHAPRHADDSTPYRGTSVIAGRQDEPPMMRQMGQLRARFDSDARRHLATPSARPPVSVTPVIVEHLVDRGASSIAAGEHHLGAHHWRQIRLAPAIDVEHRHHRQHSVA